MSDDLEQLDMFGSAPPGLPAALPDIDAARLPAVYQAARVAIAECVEIDECRTWANKHDALASYARQAHDDTLLKHCQRIKARATRRYGELLQEIPSATGAHLKREGAHPLSSTDFVKAGFDRADGIYAAGRAAKLSTHQIKTALRVANVPKEQFEAVVESNDPPSTDALAKLGRQKQAPAADRLAGRAAEDFQQARALLGLFRNIRERGGAIDAPAALRGLSDAESNNLLGDLRLCLDWMQALETALRRRQERPRPPVPAAATVAQPAAPPAPRLSWVGKSALAASCPAGAYVVALAGRRPFTFAVMLVERQKLAIRAAHWLPALAQPTREVAYQLLARVDELGRSLGEADSLAAAQAMAEADHRAQAPG